MKNKSVVNIFLLSSLSLALSQYVQAEYIMSIPLNNHVVFKDTANSGESTQPETLTSTTAWEDSGTVSCSSWTPDPSTVTAGTQFSQSGIACTQVQIRQYEEYHLDSSNHKIVTQSETQQQTISVDSITRSSVGTKQEDYFFSNSSPKYGYFCRVSGDGYGAGYYFYEETIYWNDVQVMMVNTQSNVDRCAIVQSTNNNYVGTDATYKVDARHYVKRIPR